MTNTIQVAKDRAYDATKTVLPLEVARGVYIKNPPSAAALKLLHLMINISGGRMADEMQHDMRLSEHICKVVPMICAVEVSGDLLHFIKHRCEFILLEQVVELVTILDL